MDTLRDAIELVLWAAMVGAVLLGLLLRIGEAVRRVYVRWRHHPLAGNLQASAGVVLAVSLSIIGGMAVSSTPALAGQGYWWGFPVNPGFDRNTVIQVVGTATQVDIAPRGGPCTLSLQTPTERFTVMLGPGWYLSEQKVDIQNGDPLLIEGSKMMDRRGDLHLVAARVTNQRTGTVLELRDNAGRPRWMSDRPAWK
jgi:hypothetical protein